MVIVTIRGIYPNCTGFPLPSRRFEGSRCRNIRNYQSQLHAVLLVPPVIRKSRTSYEAAFCQN